MSCTNSETSPHGFVAHHASMTAGMSLVPSGASLRSMSPLEIRGLIFISPLFVLESGAHRQSLCKKKERQEQLCNCPNSQVCVFSH